MLMQRLIGLHLCLPCWVDHLDRGPMKTDRKLMAMRKERQQRRRRRHSVRVRPVVRRAWCPAR